MAELQVAEVPREIAVGPEYGLAILKGADPRATDLALFMLSPDGARGDVDYAAARSFASTDSASRTQ